MNAHIWHSGRSTVPRRALVISVVALSVPVASSFWFTESSTNYELLLWLLALVPAFLLAYYRGWRGVATTLAAGMVALTAVQLLLLLLGRAIGNWPLLLGVVVAYGAISLGIGILSELIHRRLAEAERMALTDELTGMPNRRHARILLDLEFAAAARGRPLVVVSFDLDGFKQYNDRYGHAMGDDALRFVGDTLLGNTRKSNLTARVGGEEFLSILSSADITGAMIFIDRIRAGLRKCPLEADPVTVSAGLAAFHPGMASVEELLAAADRALYEAKAAGGDMVRVAGGPGEAPVAAAAPASAPF